MLPVFHLFLRTLMIFARVHLIIRPGSLILKYQDFFSQRKGYIMIYLNQFQPSLSGG
jgi:hypothetical protein